MTRAFVAVEPPGSVLDAVDAAIAAVEHDVAGARWTTRAQHHITLQFLGNRADVDAVAEALRALAVCAGDVRVGGAGAFPNERRGRVLWAGIAEGTTLLQQLAAAVGVLLLPLGHEPEAREYHPHLTLARCKTPTDLRPAVATLRDRGFGDAWRVDRVVLYESIVRRTGAEYTERASIPLAR